MIFVFEQDINIDPSFRLFRVITKETTIISNFEFEDGCQKTIKRSKKLSSDER